VITPKSRSQRGLPVASSCACRWQIAGPPMKSLHGSVSHVRVPQRGLAGLKGRNGAGAGRIATSAAPAAVKRAVPASRGW
jgi:hypothetical protein